MKENPYDLINTISLSSLSRCQKWILTTLYVRAKDGNCTICLRELHQLTSTSIRHLSRIINQLAASKIIQITRRPGRCNIYQLPSALDLHTDGSLIADHNTVIAQKCKDVPAPSRKNIDFAQDKNLIIAWQKAFNEQYQPVCQKEQDAMDFMLWAHLNNKIGDIKLPAAYLKTLVKNGHTTDFMPFSKRQKNLQKQKVKHKKKIIKERTKEKQKDDLWLIYKRFDKEKQASIKNDFEQNEIKKNQPKIVQDIYSRDGFQNQMISALYRHYVCNNIPI